ncbi:DEAD/DEAH box helicase [Methanogenium sp. S4BF]|uniref:DEAD/DEAH box helicase n=1 Tax=Methanogenium sp. S4BF TaxID=1789226 RepID=UPI002416ECF3|nr:DEAD/DEAH box helicase [Methanogenium sp. S4BF]WFN35288.1 DEAD/DEAH box helicase [Methanogenium sp. S4BF]
MPVRSLLSPEIQETLLKRNFQELSFTQQKAIPPICEGHHLLLIAPTGTGKTESAMLPVFDQLLRVPGSGFKAIYITPLRSLNRDILFRLQWWCHELGLSVGVRHGDTSQYERRKQALNPPDLLITTPETLQALFIGKRLREHLPNVRYVIIDEIHELAGSKRGAQLSIALERLAAYAGEFQRIGLSATVGNPEEVAAFLTGNGRPHAIVNIPAAPHMDVSVRFAGEDFDSQVRAVERCIDHEKSSLLFVNTRSTAEALGHRLYERGDVEVHHGSLSKEIRIDAEDRFKRGEIRSLICTSSMELGIDIGHIERVIQFGSPREVSRLLQRVGRAGHRLDTVSHGTILSTGFDDLCESLVITRRAKENESEDVSIIHGALDVLANQIAALLVEYGEITLERVTAIIERAYGFSDTGAIPDVCRQMAEHRLIRMDGSLLTRTGRCRTYLYGNLSMIPDEKKVQIFDLVSRRTVGTLDESFVIGWINTGATFIVKGQLWEVVDLDDGKIIVEPAHAARGELPSWEGEQIPVPFAIAQETGRLRRTRSFAAYDAGALSEAYAEDILISMDESGAPVGSDRLVTLEHFDEGVVMNICGGHKANEALSRVLSILLTARYGSSVGIEVGAYRILFRLPSSIRAADIRDLLYSVDPSHIEGLLRLAMKRTALFKWKIVQIAKKFGAIDPQADYERISIHRLLDTFEGTPIQTETYRELFTTIMDVHEAAMLVQQIQSGETEVVIAPLSAIGREGLSSSRDLIPPPSADHAIIAAVRRRIEDDNILLFCMNCRAWKSLTKVSRVADPPQCPKCGARLVAALKPWEDELIPAVKKKQKNEDEAATERRFMKNANIVLSSGRKAVVALAARGVGPENASRIIARMCDGDEFYREILKAERNYIKTHRFW